MVTFVKLKKRELIKTLYISAIPFSRVQNNTLDLQFTIYRLLINLCFLIWVTLPNDPISSGCNFCLVNSTVNNIPICFILIFRLRIIHNGTKRWCVNFLAKRMKKIVLLRPRVYLRIIVRYIYEKLSTFLILIFSFTGTACGCEK